MLPPRRPAPQPFTRLDKAVAQVAGLQRAGDAARQPCVAHRHVVLAVRGLLGAVAAVPAHGDGAVIVADRGGCGVVGGAAGRLVRAGAVHHNALGLAQLVDGADGVDGGVQGAAGVEVLLDSGQEIGGGAGGGAGADDEGMLQRLVGGDALLRVDGQAAADEVLGLGGDAAPVLDGGEAVVGAEDGLHLLEVGVAVEGGVAAQQEVGDDADGPQVDGLAVAGLAEDLGRHVAGGAAGGGQDVELVLVHDAREPEVGDEQVGVVLGRAEQQVLGLEVAVHDAVLVEVGNGRQHRADQVRRVRLVVRALAADAVEQLAAQRQVGDEVEVVHGLEVVDEREDVLVAHRDLSQHGDLVANLRPCLLATGVLPPSRAPHASIPCACSLSYHVFPARHEPLIDHLGGIVPPGVDVDAFLDDRVGPGAQRLADLVAARLDVRLRTVHRSREREGGRQRRLSLAPALTDLWRGGKL